MCQSLSWSWDYDIDVVYPLKSSPPNGKENLKKKMLMNIKGVLPK